MSYRDHTRRALNSENARTQREKYYQRIRKRHVALQSFASVDALVRELHDPGSDRDRKDNVLLALIEEHQRGGAGEAFALLARALFPAVEHAFLILRRRRRWLEDMDDSELWGRIVGAFIDTLDRYPLHRRRRRVAANVQLDTMAVLRREHEREQRLWEERRQATELMKDHERGGSPLTFGDLVVPGRETPVDPDGGEFRAAERALDAYVDEGVIDHADRFLLLGVNLYGQRLGRLGEELGLNREAAKKRHLRAMRRVRGAARARGDRSW